MEHHLARSGYNIEFCVGQRTSTQCSVTCAADYTGASPTDACSSPGGVFNPAGPNDYLKIFPAGKSSNIFRQYCGQ
eukprot:2644187-Amphidinium_carterae.2